MEGTLSIMLSRPSSPLHPIRRRRKTSARRTWSCHRRTSPKLSAPRPRSRSRGTTSSCLLWLIPPIL